MAACRHWSFKRIHVLKHERNDVKRDALVRFGLTARQFNSIHFDLDQAVSVWRGTLKHRRGQLLDKVASVKNAIATFQGRMSVLDKRISLGQASKADLLNKAKLKTWAVGKKVVLDALRGKLLVIDAEGLRDIPRICFGGRKLLRDGQRQGMSLIGDVPDMPGQHGPSIHGPSTGDVAEWQLRREDSFRLVGAKCETAGNQSCQYTGQVLRLRLPNSMAASRGGNKYVYLQGVDFRYGQTELMDALTRGAALTWLFFRDEQGRWHAHVTMNVPNAPLVTSVHNGVLSIDLNIDHLAVVTLNPMGSVTGRMKFKFPDSRVLHGRAQAMMGDAVAALCNHARKHGLAVACEELNFQHKKADLHKFSAEHARKLSGFAYSQFFQMLQRRCARHGIHLCTVNPAYTSQVGRLKYAHHATSRMRCAGLNMSVHHAAAVVIGRKAMGLGERCKVSSGVILTGPARNRVRTDLRRWRGAILIKTPQDVPGLAQEVSLEAGSRPKGRNTARSGVRSNVGGTGYRPTGSSPYLVHGAHAHVRDGAGSCPSAGSCSSAFGTTATLPTYNAPTVPRAGS